MQYKKIFYGIMIVFGLMIIASDVKAATVSASFEMPIDCKDCHKRGGIYLPGYKGLMTGSIQKTFNFKKNTANVSQDFILNMGEVVNAENAQTTGSWVQTGEFSDTPPMDGALYVGSDYRSNKGQAVYANIFSMGVSIPLDKGDVQIISDNPNVVSCVGLTCTAVASGTTNVRVKFLANKPLTSSEGFYGNSSGFGLVNVIAKRTQYSKRYEMSDFYKNGQMIEYPYYTLTNYETINVQKEKVVAEGFELQDEYEGEKSLAYSFSDIVYRVTVPQTANTAQSSSCSSITNLSTSTATVNWSYSDANNDPQTNYQIQISTNASFTNIVKSVVAPANTNVSATRSTTVSGLTPNTQYYAQVRTYNNVNYWSAYSNCVSGFKTLQSSPDDLSLPVNGTCNNTSQNSCYTGTPTATTPNSTWNCSGLNGGTTATNCSVISCSVSSYSCQNDMNGYSTQRRDNCGNITNCSAGQICSSGLCRSCTPTATTYCTTDLSGIVNSCGTVVTSCSSGQSCSLVAGTPTCVTSVADCQSHDGVILKNGESKIYYDSRLSNTCTPYTAYCVGGALRDGPLPADPIFSTSEHKFQRCAILKVSEF